MRVERASIANPRTEGQVNQRTKFTAVLQFLQPMKDFVKVGFRAKYGNASIISPKRVVFNIKGNDYRLIVDIEYKLKIVFVVWFGTHAGYDRIDAKTVYYEN